MRRPLAREFNTINRHLIMERLFMGLTMVTLEFLLIWLELEKRDYLTGIVEKCIPQSKFYFFPSGRLLLQSVSVAPHLKKT